MSQVTDYTDAIPDSELNMAELETILEEVFEALASANRGSTAPTNPFEGMFWWDSSANPEILKRYTVAAGWVTILSLNITTGVIAISGYVLSSLFTANTILAATTAATPAALTIPEQTIIGRLTGGAIKALTVTEVNTLLGGSVLPWALISDEKSHNTDGGDAVADTFNARTLNTITGSEGSGNQTWCTLASSKFKLSVGTYFIEASAPAFSCYAHQIFLYNYSSTAYSLTGTSEYSASGANSRSVLRGLLTVTDADHEYGIVHYTSNNQATTGLGRAVDADDLLKEVYTTLLITKHS